MYGAEAPPASWDATRMMSRKNPPPPPPTPGGGWVNSHPLVGTPSMVEEQKPDFKIVV